MKKIGKPVGEKTGRKRGSVGLLTRPQNAPDFSATPPAAEVLEYRNEDWADYRTAAGLTLRAGVVARQFGQVLVKELVDNALDAAVNAAVTFGLLHRSPGRVVLYVADDGEGVPGTDEQIADRYSIRREMVSSKRLRRPTRGALGNGLRVVMGVACVGEGVLRISTRGRTLTLRPRADDGRTEIIDSTTWTGFGTHIEVELTGAVADTSDPDHGLFDWAEEARLLARGKHYSGGSSAWWYGGDDFWALLQSAGDRPVLRQLAEMEGYSDKDKAAVVAGDLADRKCRSLSKAEAGALLARARAGRGPVAHDRLEKVGKRDDFRGYGRETGTIDHNGGEIPFVVEAWANVATRPGITVCLNRTPVVNKVTVQRDGNGYWISGAGLNHVVPGVGKRGREYRLVVNVIAPAVPLLGLGKEPNLRDMVDQIAWACKKAIGIAKNKSPRAGKSLSQKDIIRAKLLEAAVSLSDSGRTIFSLRQLFYRLRPALISAIGQEPDYGWFSTVVGEYEDERGEIPELYRDNRGTLYHPHGRDDISLGSRMVGQYQRPAWGFNKVLYCEKEGFFPILKQAGFPERYDCALLTSKGFATRAARDVLRVLQGTGEQITFFCVHDADGPGTVIYESLKTALKPEGIEVIDLGLNPAEGRRMGLQEEPVSPKKNNKGERVRVPVGSYLPAADQEWLQGRRIELNAMTSPEFLEWLEAKLSAHGAAAKVVPPAPVVGGQLREQARAVATQLLNEEAIRRARVSDQVDELMRQLDERLAAATLRTSQRLSSALLDPAGRRRHWTHLVGEEAESLVRPALGSNGPDRV